MRTRVGVGALLLLSAGLIFYPDDSPPQDADLLLELKTPADTDNAYHDFAKIAATVQFDTGKLAWLVLQTESASPEWPEIERLIARNGTALDHFADFARKPLYRHPGYNDPSKTAFETPIPQFWPLVTAARLESLRAERLAGQGRGAEALRSAFLVVDAGQTLLRSESSLITSLVGLLTRDLGAKRARALVEAGRLDRASLEEAARRLAALPSAAGGVAAGLKWEYAVIDNSVLRFAEIATRPPKGRWYYGLGARVRYLYLPNRTRGYVTKVFRDTIEAIPRPCSAPLPEPQPPPRHPGPNIVGRIFLNIALPRFHKLAGRRCESDYRTAAAAALAAAAAYRMDRKVPPADLATLVPAYLDAVPVDPYSGQPLRYDGGRIVTDGKDSEGKAL